MACEWKPIGIPTEIKTSKEASNFIKETSKEYQRQGIHKSHAELDTLSKKDAKIESKINSKELYGLIDSGADARSILEAIEDTSFSSLNKRIASVLIGVSNKLSDLKFNTENNDDSLGKYDFENRTVSINKDLESWDIERVLLHEMLHDVLTGLQRMNPKDLTRNQKEFVSQVEKLYNKAKQMGVKGYGMTSKEEFLTEALTNPSFQTALSNKLFEPRITLWDKVVQAIHSMLNLKGSPRSIEDFLNMTDHFINGNNIYQHNHSINKDVLYSKRDKGYRASFAKVNGFEEFIDKITGRSKSYENRDTEILENSIKRAHSLKRDYKELGVVISYKDSDSEIKKKIARIHSIKAKDNNKGLQISSWLNEGADTATKDFETDDGNRIHSVRVLEKFKRLINLSAGQTFLTIKELEEKGIKINKDMMPRDSDNYMFTISEKDGVKTVQVYSFIKGNSSEIVGEGFKKKNLLEDFFSNFEIKRFSFGNLLNNNKGVQKFNTLILAKHIQANNPDVKIKNPGVIKLSRDSVKLSPVFVSDYDEMFKLFKEKNADIIEEMGEDMKKAFETSQSINVDFHLNEYIGFLNELNEDYLDGSLDPQKHLNAAALTQSKIELYSSGIMTNKDLISVLNARMVFLNKMETRLGASVIAIDVEKKALAKAIFEADYMLKNSGFQGLTINEGRMGMFKNIFDIRNTALQYAKTKMFDAQDAATDKTKKDIKKFQELAEKLRIEKSVSKVTLVNDNYNDLYGNLFVTEEVLDSQGNKVTVKSRVLKNPNNKEQADTLSDTEIEMINEIDKLIKENIIKQMIHQSRENPNFYKDKVFDVDLAREAAEGYVRDYVTDYAVPVFYKTSEEILMGGDVKEAFKHSIKTINEDGTLDENFVYTEEGVKDANDVSISDMVIKNNFDSQRSIEEIMRANGLDRNEDGDIILVDKEMNDRSSLDIETIIMRHTHYANRKIELESQAVPAYLTAKSLLKEFADTEDNHKVLGELKRRYMDNKRPNFEEWEKRWNKYLKPLTSLLAKTGIAINPNTLTSAYFMNKFGKIRLKLSNDLDWFASYEDLSKANLWVASNYSKAKKIAININQLRETEDDLLNTHFFKKSALWLGSNEFQYGLLTSIDEGLRIQVAIAQLMKDNVLEAYDDEGNYDPSKDPRFKGDEGQRLKNQLIEDQKRTNMISESVTEPVNAYTYHKMRTIKNVVGRYIIGGMTSREVPLFLDSFLGSNLAVFKRHISSLVSRALSPSVISDSFSFKEGDQIMNHAYMGQWTAIAKTMREHEDWRKRGLKEYYNTMPDDQKSALKQGVASFALYAGVTSLLALAAAFGYEDEDEHYYTNWFMNRMRFVMSDTIASLNLFNISDSIFQTPFALGKLTSLYEGNVAKTFTSNSFGNIYDLITEGGKENK